MKVELATPEDQADIVRVANLSKYTKGASSPHYLNEKAFEKGWVAIVRTKKGWVAGFVIVRHLVREDYTSLYYVGTDPEYRERGVGASLVRWALETSPHGLVRLICEKSNTDTVSWYRTHGFALAGEGKNKGGDPYWILTCTPEEFRDRAE